MKGWQVTTAVAPYIADPLILTPTTCAPEKDGHSTGLHVWALTSAQSRHLEVNTASSAQLAVSLPFALTVSVYARASKF